MAGEVEDYIRRAAAQRGIDPDVAVRVAQSEGGTTEYARRGTFKTGSSWWPFQLHYGGPGHEQLGNVAGMGNTFTAKTGWQPGDPDAWRAATDFALDQAKQSGWGQWYGARNVGITGFQGIDRNAVAAPAPQTAPRTLQDAQPDANGPAWYRDLAGARDLAMVYGRDDRGQGRQALPDAPLPSGSDPAWYRELLRSGGARPATSSAPAAPGGGDQGELWPVAGQPWGKVNNPFGGPQSRAAGATVGLPSYNVGADLTAPYGAAIIAPVSGQVLQVYDAPNEQDRNLNGGWGGMVLFRGDNGLTYRFSHQKPGSLRVAPGQRVQQGQQLGQVGVSGNSTGSHLDFELWDRPGHFLDAADPSNRGATGRSVGAPAAASGTSASGTAPAWYLDLVGR